MQSSVDSDALCPIIKEDEIEHEDARWGVEAKLTYVLLDGWLRRELLCRGKVWSGAVWPGRVPR